MNDVTADWEFLLWGTPDAPTERAPARLRWFAAARTGRGLRILHREGWGSAQSYLRELRSGPGHQRYARLEPRAAVQLARREVVTAQLVLRLVEPNALCLARSFAHATYFSALGLPAEVVVARQRTSVGGRFSFHAWTELHGEVLNDIPGVQSGYSVLQRVCCHHLLSVSRQLNGHGVT